MYGDDLLYEISKLIEAEKADYPTIIIGKMVQEQRGLCIKIGSTESNMIIPPEFYFVGALCKEFWVPYEGHFEEDPHKHHIYHHDYDNDSSEEITKIKRVLIWRGIQEGDTVLVLQYAQGQRYYIMQRLEGVEDGGENNPQ